LELLDGQIPTTDIFYRGSLLSSSTSPKLNRWLLFFAWVLVCGLLFWKPLFSLFQLANHDETASHILLVPLIAAWLLYVDRKQLPLGLSFDWLAALFFLAPALLITFLIIYCNSCAPRERLSGYILALILFLISGFIGILGKSAANSSRFALAFLLFAVPLPDFLLDRVIYELQWGSAEIAGWFFDISGTPVLREGLVFHLPHLSVNVAPECSGIRSSLALLILALLVAHFSFRPLWKQAVFVIAGLAMMLIKNGIRIATLTLLANNVNPEFLYGKLHHRGGFVFFLIGLALLLPVYWLLRRGERVVGESATGGAGV